MLRDSSPMPHSRAGFGRILLGGFLLLAVAGFGALALWQVERRAEKLQLMAAVDLRIHAPATPAPGRAAWPAISAAADVYRRVRVEGAFLHDRETLVQAVTDQGPGFWVMTPLRTDAGWAVLVNRGFVPPEKRAPATRAAAHASARQTVTGLLRISEPKGAFLRSNDPAADHWYSRDVAAIARSRHLDENAPYFIDADASSVPGAYPIGGLTVIAFPNNHLVYALTWFALAGMSLVALIGVIRRPDSPGRKRKGADDV